MRDELAARRAAKALGVGGDDLCMSVNPDNAHPLDPFAGGRLVLRRHFGPPGWAEAVHADSRILLWCDFLRGLVTKPWEYYPLATLQPPVPLQQQAVFPPNTAVCWGWRLTLAVRPAPLVYVIGDWRPSIDVMEAAWPSQL